MTTELTGVQKSAYLHRLSRLIAYAPNDELRQLAVEVEQYMDQLVEALEARDKQIATYQQEKSLMVDALHAAVALNSAGININDFDDCVSRLHEWGALPDYCIALYVDFLYGIVSENKLFDFGYINDNGAFSARQAEKRIAELEASSKAESELFLRAKALMYCSGGSPIENSLNPIDAWLYDAERAAGVAVEE